MNLEYDYGYTGGLRVSLYNDWINQTMASVPEPGTIVLLITGAGIFPFLRRRKRK